MAMREYGGLFWLFGAFGLPPAGTWSRPAPILADAYQDGDDLVVLLDLPGVQAGAITVRAQGHVVTVEAERRPPDLGDRAVLRRSERRLGVVGRKIHCNQPVDTAQISSEYRDGVLVLRIAPADHHARRVELAPSDAARVG